MALPLEQTIMNEIGLGAHYNWLNGSGSCKYIRHQAADKLAAAIQKHADAGEDIVPPDDALINEVQSISRQIEASNTYTLTAVWIAASYAVAAHIHAFTAPERLQSTTEYLREKYPLASINRYDRIFNRQAALDA